MSVAQALFYCFVALAAFGAAGILFSSSVFRSALYLLVTLVSVAAIYALSFAEFLAVTQILIYGGGITVILIFGIMLTSRITGTPLVVRNTHIVSGGIAAIALFVLLTRYLPAMPLTRQTLEGEDISFIALRIFSTYSLPFELSGILLLIALVGAAVVSSQFKSQA